MSDQKILEKALRIAYKNGWRPLKNANFNNCQVEQWQDDKLVGVAVLFPNRDMPVTWMRELEGIIFNHDFARALWGDVETVGVTKNLDNEWLKLWQYNLQQMVIADNAIKYLGENI